MPSTPRTLRPESLPLVLATISFALSFAAWGLVGGLAPFFADIHSLNASQTALLVAVPVLLGSLARLPMGMLTDRYGGRGVFTGVMIAAGIAHGSSRRSSPRATLRCFNATDRGTCTNRRTIQRQHVEMRVLSAMKERFFDPKAFAEFCEGFTEEINRLRREHQAKLAAAPREIASIERRQQAILELLFKVPDVEVFNVELRQLEERKKELKAAIAAAKVEPRLPSLHPHMAEVFRRKAETLAAALEREQEHDAARQTLRGFLDQIVIPPGDGLLQVVGNLGEMLTAASGRDGSALAAVGNVGCGGGI